MAQFEDNEVKLVKGKTKSAKGAPRPRKTRGRTVNRRRARFIAKCAKKLAKIAEADMDPAIRSRLIANYTAAMKLSQDAQVRHTQRLGKK